MLDDMRQGFSILIPSWRNFPYLDLCVRSIREHSSLPHEVIVHFNEGGIVPFGVDVATSSEENLGVCGGVNRARSMATRRVLCYLNDDHVVLPGWDEELLRFYEERCSALGTMVWLSPVCIEPVGSNPSCITPRDYGRDVRSFDLPRLLRDLDGLRQEKQALVTTWPPHVLHAEVWDAIGGYDEGYWPGFGSDPDIVLRCWNHGVRDFVGVPRSLVYHFSSVTARRVDQGLRGRARQLFQDKHGVSIADFVEELGRGQPWRPSR